MAFLGIPDLNDRRDVMEPPRVPVAWWQQKVSSSGDSQTSRLIIPSLSERSRQVPYSHGTRGRNAQDLDMTHPIRTLIDLSIKVTLRGARRV